MATGESPLRATELRAGLQPPGQGDHDRTLSRSCPTQKSKNFVSRARATPLRCVALSRLGLKSTWASSVPLTPAPSWCPWCGGAALVVACAPTNRRPSCPPPRRRLRPLVAQDSGPCVRCRKQQVGIVLIVSGVVFWLYARWLHHNFFRRPFLAAAPEP